MKRISAILSLWFVLIGGGALWAQSSYDLRFVVPPHIRAFEKGKFLITVQIKANGQEFGLGTSNLVFTYDTTQLVQPALLEAHHFSGGHYYTMTVTEPVPGRVSINIELLIPHLGTTVTQEFMNVATLCFRRRYPGGQPQLAWRTVSPNATIVFADDEMTIVPPGNLVGWQAPGIVDPPVVESRAAGFRLLPNHPNPFNPETTIAFELSHASRITLHVFDLMGRQVRTLMNRQMPPGKHQVVWNGTDDRENPVPSGAYILRLRVGNSVQTRRLLLVR